MVFPEHIGIEPYFVHSCTKPVFNIDNWGYITIEFTDVIGDLSTTKALFGFTSGIKLDNFIIEMLDPTGVSVEKWSIDVDTIEDINFGELNYGNNDCIKPFMKIKHKKCTLLY